MRLLQPSPPAGRQTHPSTAGGDHPATHPGVRRDPPHGPAAAAARQQLQRRRVRHLPAAAALPGRVVPTVQRAGRDRFGH